MGTIDYLALCLRSSGVRVTAGGLRRRATAEPSGQRIGMQVSLETYFQTLESVLDSI